jgi:hypothetical protein
MNSVTLFELRRRRGDDRRAEKPAAPDQAERELHE